MARREKQTRIAPKRRGIQPSGHTVQLVTTLSGARVTELRRSRGPGMVSIRSEPFRVPCNFLPQQSDPLAYTRLRSPLPGETPELNAMANLSWQIVQPGSHQFLYMGWIQNQAQKPPCFLHIFPALGGPGIEWKSEGKSGLDNSRLSFPPFWGRGRRVESSNPAWAT